MTSFWNTKRTTFNRKGILHLDYDKRIKFEHGVIVCAGTSEDTVLVNMNKTIQRFGILPPPPPCNQCRLVYNEDYPE